MLALIMFCAAAVVGLLLWRLLSAARTDAVAAPPRRPATGQARPRVSGPDDDPDFLRQLDEKVRRREDPPA